MFDIDKWQEIFSTIQKHKLRTLLTAFGVFWGIFMLVLLLGAGKGLENGAYQSFGTLAQNTMWIWGGRTSVPFKGLKPGRWVVFTNEDYHKMLKDFPEIKYLNPSKGLSGNYGVGYKKKNGLFDVRGEYPEANMIRPMSFTGGRFINNLDIQEKRKVAVIGSRVVEVLFGSEPAIGKYIKIKGAYFLVIGTFQAGNAGDGKEDAQKIIVPLSSLQQTFNAFNKIETFTVTPKQGVDADQLEVRIKQYLAQRHSVYSEDPSAIGSWNSGNETKKFVSLFSGINVFIWVVGIMTIIAGIVGISNIMLIVVKERTREIGIRKAIGATPASIIGIILTESVFITSVAGYLGLCAGVGLVNVMGELLESAGAQNTYFHKPEVDLKTALIATIILIVSGSLAGLFPAIRAANINTIEALRTE